MRKRTPDSSDNSSPQEKKRAAKQMEAARSLLHSVAGSVAGAGAVESSSGSPANEESRILSALGLTETVWGYTHVAGRSRRLVPAASAESLLGRRSVRGGSKAKLAQRNREEKEKGVLRMVTTLPKVTLLPLGHSRKRHIRPRFSGQQTYAFCRRRR